jgi:hypothetical protein
MRNGVQTREVREAILDAGERLLAGYGYKKMTIDDLAREVGIGKGSVYLHFTFEGTTENYQQKKNFIRRKTASDDFDSGFVSF